LAINILCIGILRMISERFEVGGGRTSQLLR
jgi:hypothetical protein